MNYSLKNKIDSVVEIVINNNQNKFVDNYKDHISIDLIKVIIKSNLFEKLSKIYDGKTKITSTTISNATYKSVVPLFEQWLEKGCKVSGNGHHVAQWFTTEFIKEINNGFPKDEFIDENDDL